MISILRTISALGVVGLAAGCSATGHPAAAKDSSAATTPPTTVAAAPSASAPAAWPTTIAKLTAACPLLSADELKSLLGGGVSQTKVTAREEKPETTYGYTSYNCDYGSNGKYPFTVGVDGIAGKDYTPAAAINAIAKASKVTTHGVSGVGKAGVYYTHSTYSLLAASKQSHGETRTVFVSMPTFVPEQKFIDVAKVVISRI